MSEPGVCQGDFALKARTAVKMKNALAIFPPAAPHLFIPCCQPPAARLAGSAHTRACSHGFLSAREGRLRKKSPWGKEERQQRLKKCHRILPVFPSGQTLPRFTTCGQQLQSFNGMTASAVFCLRTWATGSMQVTNTDMKPPELLKPGGLQRDLFQMELACGKTPTRACSLPVPTIRRAGIS